MILDLSEGSSHSIQGQLEYQETADDVQQTPKKRRFTEPRYVGDIRTPDVTTPQRAKRSLFMAKKKIKELSFRNKMLRQQNRRMSKKIQTLGDLVNQLRKKNLISEDCHDNLVVRFIVPLLLFYLDLKVFRKEKY